jgi:glycosyltransferase involved in cell wall biosynthesis
VVPAHDEQDNLRPLRIAIKEALDGHVDYEVIIVDDASRDATRSVAREIASEDTRFRLVALARNSGETAAGWAGMKEARGELICVMDADLQNDPRDLPRMLERIGEFDVVCGWRRRRGDGDGLLRRVSSRIANAVRNALSNETIHDSGCTYRVFRRECIEGLQLFAGMHRFLPTLFKAQGWKVTEVEVANRPRHSGRSKYGVWNRVFRAFHDLLAVRWMLSRWIRLEVADRAGQGLLDEAAAQSSHGPR